MIPKWHNFSKPRGEVNGNKFGKCVETLTYVPIERQVDSFFRAGARFIDSFSDKDYDSTADDPVDDPLLGVRDFDLEDVGHEMARFMQKTDKPLTASTEQASEAASAAEAGKNEFTGSDPKSEDQK